MDEKKNNRTVLWLLIIFIPLIAIAVWVILDFDNVKSIFSSDSETITEIIGSTPVNNVNDQNQDPGSTSNALDTKDNKTDNTNKPASEENSNDNSIASGSKIDQNKPDASEKKPEKESEKPKVSIASNKDTYYASGNFEDVTQEPMHKFHVITGGFLYRENADKLVEELNNMGFKSGVIGEFNGFYYVSACAFKKKANAKIYETDLRDLGYDAWLYYYQ